MKLQIRFVKRNDCFISLPRPFATMIGQNYSNNEIASIIKAITSENIVLYLSYNGLISEKETEIEISHIFASLNGLQEGDFIECVSEFQKNNSARLELFCKPDDYEVINQKRTEIESSLLNSITVVFNKVKFPIYISQFNYVILEFIKKPEELSFYSINPNAELSIIPKDGPDNQKMHANIKKVESVLIGKIQKLPEKAEFADFNQNFIFVPEEVFKKFNLISNKPYFLNHKLVKNRNNLSSLGNYLKKIENFNNKKENKKPSKILYVYIQPLPLDFFSKNLDMNALEFTNPIFISSPLLKTLNLPTNLPIKLDFLAKITDYTRHKFCNLPDFTNPKLRFNIYLFPITNSNNYPEDLIKAELITFIINNFIAKKVTPFYNGQFFKYKEAVFAIKLLDNAQDKKILMEMLTFEEIKPGMKFSPEELKSMGKMATEKIVVAKHQDFINNFSEKTVNSYNIFVKRKLNSLETNIKPDFLLILFSQELSELESFLLSNIRSNQRHILASLNSCLLSGVSGNGKTSLLKTLKRNLKQLNFETIDFNEITNIKHSSVPPLDVIKGYIEGRVQLACMKEPSVVIMDNVHLAAKNIERIDFQQSHEILLSEVFGKFLKDLMKKYRNVSFILVCDNKEFLNNQLSGVFAKEWSAKLPNFAQRKRILEEMAKNYQNFPFDNIEELATLCDNFNLRNLDLLFKRTAALKSEPQETVLTAFLDNIKAVSNKTYKSNKNYPKFEHIGGLNSAKELIRDTFEIPQKFDFLFKNIPIKMSSGILLYGPPGCGKTFIAAAAANELGMNFFSVKGPELLNKYIGASEQAVREIFEKANNVKPSIVFFDEFDAIVPRRNSGSTNVTDRVVNQFLCYLDGVASMQGVYILAASSRPDLIDPALLRPGRIDKHIYLGFPDDDDRKRILDIYYKNFKFEDIGENEIADKTKGFTASDLVALLREMQITKAHNILEKVREDPGQQLKDFELKFCREDFEETLRKFRPALSEKDIKRYEKMYADFVSGGVDIKKQKTTLY